jgi:hypothetical protein
MWVRAVDFAKQYCRLKTLRGNLFLPNNILRRTNLQQCGLPNNIQFASTPSQNVDNFIW